jgi:hypothetical protein
MSWDAVVIGTLPAGLEWGSGARPRRRRRIRDGGPVPDIGVRRQGQLVPKSDRTRAGTPPGEGGQPTAADPGPATTVHEPPE